MRGLANFEELVDMRHNIASFLATKALELGEETGQDQFDLVFVLLDEPLPDLRSCLELPVSSTSQ